MKTQSKEGHINKGNITKKSKDRFQQPGKKKKSSPLKSIGKEKGQGGERNNK